MSVGNELPPMELEAALPRECEFCGIRVLSDESLEIHKLTFHPLEAYGVDEAGSLVEVIEVKVGKAQRSAVSPFSELPEPVSPYADPSPQPTPANPFLQMNRLISNFGIHAGNVQNSESDAQSACEYFSMTSRDTRESEDGEDPPDADINLVEMDLETDNDIAGPSCKSVEFTLNNHTQPNSNHCSTSSNLSRQCTVCGQYLPMDKIKQHFIDCYIQSQNVSMHIPCPECSEIFEDMPALKIHYLLDHWLNKTFDLVERDGFSGVECVLCNLELCNAEEMAHHELLMHKHSLQLPAYMFVCTRCPKDTWLQPYAVNPAKHTIERHPYKSGYLCALCEEVQFSEHHLYGHMQSSHPEVSTSFPCDICQLQYPSINEARICHYKHETHTYSCVICAAEGIKAKYVQAHRLSCK